MRDLLESVFFYTFITVFSIPLILMFPLSLVFDQRRYRIPSTNETGNAKLERIFCLTHYALREDAWCPNCGIDKKDLVKEIKRV